MKGIITNVEVRMNHCRRLQNWQLENDNLTNVLKTFLTVLVKTTSTKSLIGGRGLMDFQSYEKAIFFILILMIKLWSVFYEMCEKFCLSSYICVEIV